MNIVGASFHGTYDTSRVIARVVSGLGWIATAIGGVISILSFASVASTGPLALLGVTIGILIVIVGLIQIAAGQGVRAAIDAADYARQSLRLQIAQAEGLGDLDLSSAYRSAVLSTNRGQPLTTPRPRIVQEGSYKHRKWRALENGVVEGEMMDGRYKQFSSLEEFKTFIS